MVMIWFSLIIIVFTAETSQASNVGSNIENLKETANIGSKGLPFGVISCGNGWYSKTTNDHVDPAAICLSQGYGRLIFECRANAGVYFKKPSKACHDPSTSFDNGVAWKCTHGDFTSTSGVYGGSGHTDTTRKMLFKKRDVNADCCRLTYSNSTVKNSISSSKGNQIQFGSPLFAIFNNCQTGSPYSVTLSRLNDTFQGWVDQAARLRYLKGICVDDWLHVAKTTLLIDLVHDFEASEFGNNCDDIGAQYIEDETLCKESISTQHRPELEYWFWAGAVERDDLPNGCVIFGPHGHSWSSWRVYFNRSKNGTRSDDAYGICLRNVERCEM